MIVAGTFLQNRYRIQEKIGQGGMGAVYIATDERFESTVAIKETLFSDPNFSKAFEREARLLNNLRHSALPRVSDHFSEDNGQFLVMEYIAGDDLSEKMEENGTAFDLKDVLNWGDQLLDALDFLHTQEMPVIHRDIKPQNLKLTPRGQIILLDFGLAKGNPTDGSHKTAANSVFGYSRNYASLEQIQGTGTDPRSDLYALGATLYHLLTGVPPVDALTRAMTVLNGGADPLRPANLVHPQVPATVADVLQRAMALNANHRPTSAVAMRAILSESASEIGDEYKAFADRSISANLLSQNTELLGDNSQSRNTEQGVVNTEIMPLATSLEDLPSEKTNALRENLFESKPGDSVVTKVGAARSSVIAPLYSTTIDEAYSSSSSNRKKGIAAAVAGLLIVGGAAGFYVMQPGNGQNVANSNTNSNVVTAENASNTNANSAALMESKNLANTSVAPGNAETASKKTTAAKPSDKTTSSSTTAVKSDKNTNQNSAEDDEDIKSGLEVLSTLPDMDSDGVKIKNGRLETDEVIIDKGRIIMKRQPRGVNVKPPLTPDQLDAIPPEQREKVKRALERQREQMERQKERMRERQKNIPPTPEVPPDN